MNSLTIRIDPVIARKYPISLLAGTPNTVGAQMLAQAQAPGLNVKTLREEVLGKSGDPAEIGEKLGKFLLAGEIGAKWEEITRQGPTRTYLDVRASGLDNAPWEFARRNATLFLVNGSPFLQFRNRAIRVIDPEWGIRVLVVVAAQDAAGEIGSLDEVTAIRSAIRPVNRIIDVDVLKWPSRDSLKKRVESYRPHVLHMIGHGDTNGLQLYDGTDNLIRWGVVEVDSDVGFWNWKPELVYLNTCRGASAPSKLAEQTAQWNVTDRFLQNGCSAVIAMHADVRGKLAGAGAAAFYEGLAGGDTVDVAIAKGRLAIAHRAPGGQSAFDPYLPCLAVTRPVEEILRHTSMVTIDECPDVAAALRTFVDRDQERRQLLSLLEAGERAVIVEGDSEVGKSWLLQWCMDAWLRRKMDVRYVEISGCQTWLDVLRAIRDGSPRKLGCVHRGLAQEARAMLNWRLNALARGVADPPADSFTGAEKEDPNWNALAVPQTAMIDAHIKAMDALQAALRKEANSRGLVIVLDNFGAGDVGLATPYFAVLRDYWANNLIVRAPSEIRVVFGLNSAQVREYALQTLPDGFKKVTLDYFPPGKFADLMLELLPLRYGDQFGDKPDKVMKGLSKELEQYDPTSQTPQINGAALSAQCDMIWRYCQGKKKAWESA